MRILLLFILTLAAGCKDKKPDSAFSFNELQIGLTSYDAFKEEKKDSLAFVAPPTPPFGEIIANNNIIESTDGKVYFYAFKKKEPVCGFMTYGGKYTFEIYKQNLDTLNAHNLQLVDEGNLNDILNKITKSEKPVAISVGLQHQKSDNKIILQLVSKLYQNTYNNVWKVRELQPKERELLATLVSNK